MVMDISLSSNLYTGKPIIFNPLAIYSLRPSKLIINSCRVTMNACDKESTNLYKVLSLSSNNAGIDEIKRAYRTMALKYHPDLFHPSMKQESTKMFLRVQEAYKTLSDPNSREEYDYEMGLSDFPPQSYKNDAENQLLGRKRWEEQILELKRRSSCGAGHKEGSWGSRVRAKNGQS